MKSYAETLDYPKILERLARHTDFSGGKALALALEPTTDIREVQERLNLTAEGRAFLKAHPDFALGGVTDIRSWTEQALHGVVLDPGILLQVRDTLVAADRFYRLLTRLEPQFPGLADIAWRIVPQPPLTEAIDRVLTERGEVRDDASPELARIRRELKVTQDRIQDKLQRMITSSGVAPYLQEALITRREGRFVIPVKADFKGQVQGIVHDRSSSGVTLFVEPMPVVEMNNALRELKLAEDEEVRHLLLVLVAHLARVADEVEATVVALSELDLAFACARYAEELGASQPQILPIPTHLPEVQEDNWHPGSVIRLYSTRHPLLDPVRVVPIDVVLDETTHFLVITGPNTGGKTVTLKTVGLLVLMAQAGMHIPAAPDSALSCFQAVYVDIGDEQSIEQSLSTFSAHLANITAFLEKVDHDSLVLLDELGAGTDPAEGSALARALLEALRERRCTALVATHYPELKLYAHDTPGVCNASMEFSAETLSPTFHLAIGVPGRSNAFAIARRLGVPEAVVKAAEGMLSGEALHAEDMLEDLHALRLEAARARDASRAAQRDVETQAAALRKRLEAIAQERQEILHQAEAEVRRETAQVRAEIEALRQRLRTLPVSGDRRTLEVAVEEIEELEAAVPELAASLVANLGLQMPEDAAPDVIEGVPAAGDTVRLLALGLEGTVLSLEGSQALVQAGAMRTRLPLEALELVRRGQRPVFESVPQRPQPVSPGMEVDLRGMMVEDALQTLDRYLDDASLSALPWVRIIHGKGTGVLRREVRRFLGDHPLVASYESAADREGGEGVTIASLLTA